MSLLSPDAFTHVKGQTFLAVFGKHPGWSDFMDDIGMETETLIVAKRVLYVKGIASQIETGAWAKLESDKRLADFNHVFLWRRPEELLVGRIWSSMDAKGRKEYPMVACADCISMPLGWVLSEMLPKLDEIRAVCQATRAAGEVISILSKEQNAIRERMNGSFKAPPNAPERRTARARFLDRHEWGPNREGLYRILHQMHGQLAAYSFGKLKTLSDTVFLRKTLLGETAALAQQIRVPQATDTPADAFRQWYDFFLHKLDAAAPVLFVLNLERHWLDITVGEPTNQEFFSLKASQVALPLASEVPYALDEESLAFARDFLVSYQNSNSGSNRTATGRKQLEAGLLLLLLLAACFAGYLRFAPAEYIPRFLHGAAETFGNPTVLLSTPS
jgi:hypothetical protein